MGGERGVDAGRENKYSWHFMAARQLAAGKKMSSFSFSAICLFQRKRNRKQPFPVWGEGEGFTILEGKQLVRSPGPGY